MHWDDLASPPRDYLKMKTQYWDDPVVQGWPVTRMRFVAPETPVEQIKPVASVGPVILQHERRPTNGHVKNKHGPRSSFSIYQPRATQSRNNDQTPLKEDGTPMTPISRMAMNSVRHFLF